MTNVQSQEKQTSKSDLLKLSLAALGVVYGDIGTSPLYALRECFHGPHATSLSDQTIYGVLSLIFWSLTLVISFKYLNLILKADNKGEGGILALTALIAPRRLANSKNSKLIVSLGLFGAALLYADGIITPAISVMSAVEGLSIATSAFSKYVQSITIAILIALFVAQRYGTEKIGIVFGPIVLVWFLTLGFLGIRQIIGLPEILGAIDPRHLFAMFHRQPREAFQIMGTVFLVVTGGEALYADIGHFGAKPIRLGWYLIALPGLLLNYFGQGALLLSNPSAIENPFYRMAPSWALYPLVALATMAAVIASQAIITGAFSLTLQAIQMGYCPRLKIQHTSANHRGQIYIGAVNSFIFIACVLLVLGFGSSSKLAAAYGLAITLTMAITTILFYIFTRRRWKWSRFIALPLMTVFLVVDLMYLGGNILKIPDGGWVPLLIGGAVFMLMATWRDGRKLLSRRLEERSLSLQKFLADLSIHERKPTYVPGSAIYMLANSRGTPQALLQNLAHNKVLHETNVLLTIETSDLPYVEKEDRLEINDLGGGFFRVLASYGFMEGPYVPELIEMMTEAGIGLDLNDISYFIGRETLIVSDEKGLARWRKNLFVRLSRNAQSATLFFGLPAEQVMEIGNQLEL